MSGFPADTLDEFVLAGRDPDAPAVVERTEITTYGELAQLVADYAKPLAELGLDVGDRIVVEAHTSATAIAMLLACSRVGATFIPVTPDTPDQRLSAIIAATDPVLHIREHSLARRDLAGTTATFGPSGLELESDPEPRRSHRTAIVGTDPAYIIFTSGTTGRPKGVVISHHAAMAFYRGAQRFGVVRPGDRVASTSPFSFDVALFDVGVTLGIGATLLPVPRDHLSFPRRLCEFLRESGATTVHAVPSIFRPLLQHEPEAVAELADLRAIMFTGEDFPAADLAHLRRLQPALRVVNAFGATETVAFSFADVPDPVPVEGLSIGGGFPGGEMLLLDEELRPIERPGEVGEIYVRGPSLFHGYWDDPEATSAVLLPDPLNPRSGQRVYRSGDLAVRGKGGEMYFRGRADTMVKIRGNRIELGEIERHLRDHSGVHSVAVLPADETLTAFVVAEPHLTPQDLAGWCRQALPSYMIPKSFRFLPDLPLSRNGKTDRRALHGLLGSHGDF